MQYDKLANDGREMPTSSVDSITPNQSATSRMN